MRDALLFRPLGELSEALCGERVGLFLEPVLVVIVLWLFFVYSFQDIEELQKGEVYLYVHLLFEFNFFVKSTLCFKLNLSGKIN